MELIFEQDMAHGSSKSYSIFRPAFKHEFQLKTVEGKGFSATRTLATGHSPFLSKPDEVKQFIIQATDKFEAAKDV